MYSKEREREKEIYIYMCKLINTYMGNILFSLYTIYIYILFRLQPGLSQKLTGSSQCHPFAGICLLRAAGS